ncbi:MAG: ATP-dependent DNA ligase [Candidatus Methanofastidiosia archaeon]
MEFSKLCETFKLFEKTTSRLEKTGILTMLLKDLENKELEITIQFVLGSIFPNWSAQKIGIGEKLIIKVVSDITGVSEKEILLFLKETGDIGCSIEKAMKQKKQVFFLSEPLTLSRVYNDLLKLSNYEGKRSQEKKIRILSGLLTNASPIEAKYLSRILVETMRTGVAEGIVRDAIAKTNNLPPSKVEKAYMVSNDMGLVARMAREGEEALSSLSLKIFRPIKMMAAQKVATIAEGSKIVGLPCAIEYKYDGFRMQIHKKGKKIKIFTRRLEDVTAQFKDVVDAIEKSVIDECIIEGETIGISHNGKWLPFQKISRRIKRKYDIDEIIEKIPVMTNIFDILYHNGNSLIDTPFKERRRILETVITPVEGKLVLSKMIITDNENEANAFFSESLLKGNEGIMLKNLESPYVPGLRVGNMLKMKSVLESLDCIIIGAEWGTGRRANLMGTFLLAILDEDGKPVPIGKVATGITDELLETLTIKLTPLVEYEKGRELKIKPDLVVEVAYEEIQKSPTYESGFALRFPRLIRLREDKGPEDADTILRVFEIYESDDRY